MVETLEILKVGMTDSMSGYHWVAQMGKKTVAQKVE
jgi:hypothetical protein